jgi:hypothetical protein
MLLNQQPNYLFAAAVAASYPSASNSYLTPNEFKYHQNTNQFYAQDSNNLLFNQLAVSAAAVAASNSNSPLSFSAKSPSSNSDLIVSASTSSSSSINTSSLNHNDSGFAESPKPIDSSLTKLATTKETSPKLATDDSRRQTWSTVNC